MDPLKFEIQEETRAGTTIKVIGVGGGGCNAAGRMYRDGMPGVEFYAINSDRQALQESPIPNKLLIGQKITGGLGAGSDPNVGRDAALEDTERIIEILDGADMVFVAAGMGGGTGTGAAPVVASLAKELNALTVAIVTKPFLFEGSRRMKMAEKGLSDLSATVDTLIPIPNERLTTLAPKGTTLLDSFRLADDVLRQAVSGINDIMNTPGLINRDFSDIRAIMQGMGYAMMGSATAKGENAAVDAAKKAIHCPMLDGGDLRGARAILINITSSSGISLHDVNEACMLIRAATSNDDLQVNFGIVMNESMGDEVKVSVIATGFQPEVKKEAPPSRVGFFSTPQPVFREQEFSPRIDMALDPEPAPEHNIQPEPQPAHAMAVLASANSSHEESTEDMEVPAFLRRRRTF
ncbi:MAG TPA: cell division protein FtsZ [Bryobacteraceae bacterium]|nr:cell division protein FtsZ [Bryobacteraceae bacterium]